MFHRNFTLKKLLFIAFICTSCSQPNINKVNSNNNILISKPEINKNSNILSQDKKTELNPLPVEKSETKKVENLPTKTTDNSMVKTTEVVTSSSNSSNTSSSSSTSSSSNKDLRKAEIIIIFKDVYKIRWYFDKYSFLSLNNADTTSINKLIKDYTIRAIEPYEGISGRTEEDLEKEEKQQEEIKGQDVPNRASIYYLSTENINAKEFIEKLKKEEIILSITENNG